MTELSLVLINIFSLIRFFILVFMQLIRRYLFLTSIPISKSSARTALLQKVDLLWSKANNLILSTDNMYYLILDNIRSLVVLFQITHSVVM